MLTFTNVFEDVEFVFAETMSDVIQAALQLPSHLQKKSKMVKSFPIKSNNAKRKSAKSTRSQASSTSRKKRAAADPHRQTARNILSRPNHSLSLIHI